MTALIFLLLNLCASLFKSKSREVRSARANRSASLRQSITSLLRRSELFTAILDTCRLVPQPVERRRRRIAGCGDRDRCGESRDQAYAVRQRIEHDTHRDTLGQADPGKGRIDVGEQVRAGAALAIRIGW